MERGGGEMEERERCMSSNKERGGGLYHESERGLAEKRDAWGGGKEVNE